MSCSKPVPQFLFDSLYYLNRDQLDRFSIVCRPLKNFIERYFLSKPYRVFDQLKICGGSYTLEHKDVQWHPNRDDYSAQQFLDGQICNFGYPDSIFYSFAEMRPYLSTNVRIKETTIFVAEEKTLGTITYNAEHIQEMESIAYLWRDGKIIVRNAYLNRIHAEDLKPILNSPTILQRRELEMYNAHFPFKDYKVLYTVKVIIIHLYGDNLINLWVRYWQEFLEQPGDKPVVAFHYLYWGHSVYLLKRLSKVFSAAVSPKAFKIVFAENDAELTEFRKMNNASGEILELKKGLPMEYQKEYLEEYPNYTLERYNI